MEQFDKCGCQWFSGKEIESHKLFETIALAHLHMENIGPVIMICNEEGYDFLARHGLEEFYIDVIIVTEGTIYEHLVNKMIDGYAVVQNSLQECSEKLRNLYAETEGTLGWIKQKVEDVVSKEQVLKSI